MVKAKPAAKNVTLPAKAVKVEKPKRGSKRQKGAKVKATQPIDPELLKASKALVKALRTKYGLEGAAPWLTAEERQALELDKVPKVFGLTREECYVALGRQLDPTKVLHCCFDAGEHLMTRASAKKKASLGGHDCYFVEYYRNGSGTRVNELVYRLLVDEEELSEALKGKFKSKVFPRCGVPRCIRPDHLVLEPLSDESSRETCHNGGNETTCKHDPKCLFLEVPADVVASNPIVSKRSESGGGKQVKLEVSNVETQTPKLSDEVLQLFVGLFKRKKTEKVLWGDGKRFESAFDSDEDEPQDDGDSKEAPAVDSPRRKNTYSTSDLELLRSTVGSPSTSGERMKQQAEKLRQAFGSEEPVQSDGNYYIGYSN